MLWSKCFASGSVSPFSLESLNSLVIPEGTNRAYLAGVTEESLKYLVLAILCKKNKHTSTKRWTALSMECSFPWASLP